MSLEKAAKLAEHGTEDDLAEALRISLPILDKNFDDPQALFIVGYIFLMSEKRGLAYQLFRRASEMSPHIPSIWSNMGKCWHEVQKLEAADQCFRKALKLKPDYSLALNNIGLIHLNRSEYGMAIEYFNRCLKIDPNNEDAQVNRGMAYLSLGNWKEGWPGYNLNIGKLKDRREIIYGEETRWNGEKGKTIIVTGEQGIGDEISFASCIPDLIADSKKVIIDCDKRIERLFRRSFPQTEVYGTRYKETRQEWHDEVRADHRITIGALPQFYRNSWHDFPGTPYLVPDPEMAVQWRALLRSLDEGGTLGGGCDGTSKPVRCLPKIGISWTGGRDHTFKNRRSVTLETLLPILKYPAHWISLQYHGADDAPEFEEKYGIKVHHWPWGVESYDYDQTVALISQLDMVVSVTTTVVHVAGALGKECHCLVPDKVMWRYLTEGSRLPWANSVTLHRQKGKEWPVYDVINAMKERFG